MDSFHNEEDAHRMVSARGRFYFLYFFERALVDGNQILGVHVRDGPLGFYVLSRLAEVRQSGNLVERGARM